MRRKFTYCLLLVLYCCKISIAADTTRVLFIGNSFTAVENVPDLVKKFAQQAGYNMEVMMHAPGGISVGDVAQGTMAHMNNPVVFDLIRNNTIDFVVLQDNQGRFVENNGFPNPAVTKVVEGHMKIRDSMRQHHDCARMIFFAGWGLKNCWPDVGDGAKCITNIYKNYKTLNVQANEIISPIGLAWLRSIAQLPNVDLWSPDEAHQSAAGGYLTAAVIFTSIFRINTEHVAFSAQIDTANARIMRRIAYETVVDSIQSSGLANYVPTLTSNNGVLTASTGYSQYEWYKQQTLVATTTANTYTPAVANCYQVVATENTGCKQGSPLHCLNSTTSIASLIKTDRISVTPNPATQEITLNTMDDDGLKYYKIANMAGQIVAEGSFETNSLILPVSSLPSGIYTCSVAISGKMLHTKFFKAQ